MSEPREQEGWGVPLRLPLIAAGGTLLVLLTGLILAGELYKHTLRPETHAPLPSLPYPRLETVQIPPRERRPDFRQPAPARIGAAMRDTAAQGDALWGKARP